MNSQNLTANRPTPEVAARILKYSMRIPRWAVATGLAATLNSQFTASAEDQSATIATLLKRIEQLEAKVNSLETGRTAAPAASTATTTPLESARLESLEQQLKVIDRKNEIAAEAAAERAKTASAFSIGASGFTFRSADTNFVLKVRGYVQADGRFYPDDSAAGTVNDSFLLRRVRPILEGTLYNNFDYRVMLDFGQNASSSAANNGFVQDAYLNWRLWPEFQIQAGKFKEPVGLERLQSGANLLFIERSYPTQFLPNRDTGVQLQGELFNGTLAYQAGLFNGVANGGSGDFDAADDDKDFAGRIFAQPFKNGENDWLRGVGLGVSGTYGNQEGALRNVTSPGQQRAFAYRSGAGTNAATANVVADGSLWRVSPQAWYYKGPFGLVAEYALVNQTVRRDDGARTFAELEHNAWQVSASYFLTGEDNSFKAVAPRTPFTLGGEGWGAWELAAQVSQFDLDDATYPTFANAASSAAGATSWGVGVNWHLNRSVKLSLNYEQTDFDGGTSPLLANGEKVILTRAQVSF